MIDTTLSLGRAATRNKRGFKKQLGDHYEEFMENLSVFLREIPEYKRMPAYLLFGDGESLPDNFEPTKKYLYRFYSNTNNMYDTLKLDAGEYDCTPVVLSNTYSINKSQKDMDKANSELQLLEARFERTSNDALSYYEKYIDLNRDNTLILDEIDAVKNSIASMNTDPTNITDKIQDACNAMVPLGFQPVGVVTYDKEGVFLNFMVNSRDVRSPNGRLSYVMAPMYFNIRFSNSGSVLINAGRRYLIRDGEAITTASKGLLGLERHPHVSGASICWGSRSINKPEMAGDYKLILSHLYQMLEIYNASSPYVTASNCKNRYALKTFKYSLERDLCDLAERVKPLQFRCNSEQLLGHKVVEYIGEELTAKLDAALDKHFTELESNNENLHNN